MYGEEEKGLSLKKFILIIVLIVAALFVLMWFFPTKQFLNKSIDKSLDQRLNDNGERLFNENINNLKTVSLSYFSESRLPKNVGDKVTLTLGEMLDKHLLTEPIDGKGDTCDHKESYTEVTKQDSEYVMKINLSCSDNKDYILVYMGSYDYCAGDICEKKKTVANANAETENVTKSENISKEKCEYQKFTNSKWSNYSNWSSWTTNKINKTNYNLVETKTEKVANGTKIVPEKKVVKKDAAKSVKTTYYCDNSYSNKGTYNSYTKCIRNSNPLVKVRNGKTIYECPTGYDNVGIYTYKVNCKKLYAPRKNVKTIYTCSNDYDNRGIYTYKVTCIKNVTVNKNVNQYKNITYYRQKTRTLISGSKYVKWSNCNDKSLINNGYSKTGNIK